MSSDMVFLVSISPVSPEPKLWYSLCRMTAKDTEEPFKGLRIPVPTPYPIGDVYCYLSYLPPVTLLDVGVNTPEAWEALVRGLAEADLRPEDVEIVVLTHGHADHYGQVHRVYKESGCRVLLHPLDFTKVYDRYGYYGSMVPYFRTAGMYPEFVETFLDVLDKETSFIHDPPKEILSPINEGETLLWMGEELQVVHLPGHCQGHIGLVNSRGRWAFTGDVLFSSMTADPIIHVDPNGERVRAMRQHLDSVNRLRKMGVEVFYPSHKEGGGLVDEAVNAMMERIGYKEGIMLEVVRSLGRATPFEIMLEFTPEVKKDHNLCFVALSDTLGRLDLLEEKGLVRCEEAGERLFYSAC